MCMTALWKLSWYIEVTCLLVFFMCILLAPGTVAHGKYSIHSLNEWIKYVLDFEHWLFRILGTCDKQNYETGKSKFLYVSTLSPVPSPLTERCPGGIKHPASSCYQVFPYLAHLTPIMKGRLAAIHWRLVMFSARSFTCTCSASSSDLPIFNDCCSWGKNTCWWLWSLNFLI